MRKQNKNSDSQAVENKEDGKNGKLRILCSRAKRT